MVRDKMDYLLKRLLTILGLLLLTACSYLPVMTPDMAIRKPSHPLKFEGVRGPLSTQQSLSILTRLKKDGAATNIFDKHLALEEEIVGSPLVVGNSVKLLVDGPETYDAMFDAIEHAHHHINIETYIIDDDEIGRRFVELLIKKQHTGVQVNLIYDSVGAINTPQAFFQPLKDSGAHVLEFNPINPLLARKGWQVNQRDHRKLLIVDGRVAFVGGVNISSVYSSSSFGRMKAAKSRLPWRDTHLQITGPVVSEFQRLFIATWDEQLGEPLTDKRYYPESRIVGNQVVRAIGSTPEEPYSQIYITLLSAINSAETRIFLTSAYFVPDTQLLAMLKEAVQRQVDVRLLLPEHTDSAMVYYASRSYYDELLAAHVKIYERHGALLHAKTAVIDGVWSTIGSTNLDWRSFLNNQEINAVIVGQEFGAQMQNLFELDLASSKEVTLDAWRKRSFGARIKEKAARLWARWL